MSVLHIRGSAGNIYSIDRLLRRQNDVLCRADNHAYFVHAHVGCTRASHTERVAHRGYVAVDFQPHTAEEAICSCRVLAACCVAMAPPFKHFTEKETELLKRWQAEGKPVREIAGLLQRDETTIRARPAADTSRRASE